MSKFSKTFNLLLDTQLFEQLVELADRAHRSKGCVIRELIRNAWTSSHGGFRTCAAGGRCLVAQAPGEDQGVFP